MSNKKTNSMRYVREIGGFRLLWEEASKKNGNMPWLVIKSASGTWQTRLRGDMGVTLIWRRMLESEDAEEYLHGQLRMMQLLSTTINDPVTELFIQSLVIGNTYLLGKDEATVSEFNKKRMEIAQELVKLVNGLLPQETKGEVPVTEEEKEILNGMRAAVVNEDLSEQKEKETDATIKS